MGLISQGQAFRTAREKGTHYRCVRNYMAHLEMEVIAIADLLACGGSVSHEVIVGAIPLDRNGNLWVELQEFHIESLGRSPHLVEYCI